MEAVYTLLLLSLFWGMVETSNRGAGYSLEQPPLSSSSSSSSSFSSSTSSSFKISFERTSDVISSARCRVRCLSQLQRIDNDDDDDDNDADDIELVNVGSTEKKTISLVDCLEDTSCSACLRPCNQPFVGLTLCHESCHLVPLNKAECVESCQFLKQINSIRPGTCPPETRATGVAALCVNGCVSDADCDDSGTLKCCSNSCGWTCQQPSHVFEGMPGVPDRPVVRERPKSNSVELRWNTVRSNYSGPILYLIDSRYNVGTKYNEHDMTSWRQAAQSTGSMIVLSDLAAGHWYQHRVSSVNVYGSQGPSLPSISYTISKEPRKPGSPVNVTEGDTIITGGKVAVFIHWLPPLNSDLPVTRYKIYWSNPSKLTSSSSSSSSFSSSSSVLREHRQVVPGDKLSFQIPNLDPDTTYFVQVQAISQFGDLKLKSDKTHLSLTTYPLSLPPGWKGDEEEKREQQPVVRSAGVSPRPPLSSPPSVVSLTSERPYYKDELLQANISWVIPQPLTRDQEVDKVMLFWSAEACIADTLGDESLARIHQAETAGTSFVIFDLRFDCRYLIRVESVSSSGVVGTTPALLTLSTPSCHLVYVIGKHRPECAHLASTIPLEPSNLQHTFIISTSNVTARLSWDPPPQSDPPITGYRIGWAQQPTLTTTDTSTASSLSSHDKTIKVLPKDATSISLGRLQEGMLYVAQVQALSKSGDGLTATIQFTTPLLQPQPGSSLLAIQRDQQQQQSRPTDSNSGSSSKRHESNKRKQQSLSSSSNTEIVALLIPSVPVTSGPGRYITDNLRKIDMNKNPITRHVTRPVTRPASNLVTDRLIKDVKNIGSSQRDVSLYVIIINSLIFTAVHIRLPFQ